jgi:mitochondrial intermediate peptidase
MLRLILGKTDTIWKQSRNRTISTISQLSTIFNEPKEKTLNFTKNQTGLFLMPELRTFEGFYLLRENVKNRSEDLIAEATNPQLRKRKMVSNIIYI